MSRQKLDSNDPTVKRNKKLYDLCYKTVMEAARKKIQTTGVIVGSLSFAQQLKNAKIVGLNYQSQVSKWKNGKLQITRIETIKGLSQLTGLQVSTLAAILSSEVEDNSNV
jgi:uncharacterized protein YunC (DUF1805 family)